jgi:hypothetical protein
MSWTLHDDRAEALRIVGEGPVACPTVFWRGRHFHWSHTVPPGRHRLHLSGGEENGVEAEGQATVNGRPARALLRPTESSCDFHYWDNTSLHLFTPCSHTLVLLPTELLTSLAERIVPTHPQRLSAPWFLQLLRAARL